jgi:hypothetical protein
VKLFSPLSKTDFIRTIKEAKENNIYTIGLVPTAVALDGLLLEGMNEIAHIKELVLELIDFDRNKNLEKMKLCLLSQKPFLNNTISAILTIPIFKRTLGGKYQPY